MRATGGTPTHRVHEITDERVPHLPIYARFYESPAAQTLTIFMPSAVPTSARRRHPRYARARWVPDLPQTHILCLADPALGAHEDLRAAWYIHPAVDVIQELAHFVSELASGIGVESDAMLLYGSSLGGFGALALASYLDGSTAFAEIPQISVPQWPIPSALDAIDTLLLDGDFGSHLALHPEQFSLKARLQHSGRIPNYRIITNRSDPSLLDQKEFHTWASQSSAPEAPAMSDFDLTSVTTGHTPLPRAYAVRQIAAHLGSRPVGTL